MASLGNWTIVFDDKLIIKQSEGIGHTIDDDSFWNDSKFSNIWAIQYGTDVASHAVEYRDNTSHSEYDSSVLGNISEFTNKWDSAHLVQLQSDWDNDNIDEETSSDKIARLGARPTSYSS